MIGVYDWRTRLEWRRAEVERDLLSTLEGMAYRVLRGGYPSQADMCSVRNLRTELVIIGMVIREASQLEAEPW